MDLGVSYVNHNPRTAGGEDQIPFLVNTTRKETLYESEAIIDYLEQHYS